MGFYQDIPTVYTCTRLRHKMKMRNRSACPKCGNAVTIELHGHVEVLQCTICGWTLSSTVYPESDVAILDKSPKSVIVRINWSTEKKNSGEVLRARKIFGELGDLPLSVLLREARESQSYILGRYPLPIAIDMQERAKANGIVLSLSSIESQ